MKEEILNQLELIDTRNEKEYYKSAQQTAKLYKFDPIYFLWKKEYKGSNKELANYLATVMLCQIHSDRDSIEEIIKFDKEVSNKLFI